MTEILDEPILEGNENKHTELAYAKAKIVTRLFIISIILLIVEVSTGLPYFPGLIMVILMIVALSYGIFGFANSIRVF